MTQVLQNAVDTPEITSSSPPRPLTEGEHITVSVTAACVALLGLVGFVISFATVQEAARPAFGWLAFLVPLGVDLGIAVFSALDITLARLNMRIRWLRLIPWTLVGATIYLNIAGQHTLFGMVAHAVLPLLWVVAVEVGAHVLRKRAGLADPARMDRVRASRWVLAPRSTFGLWRRMVLWEIRSYPAALSRERDRILAKTHLQDGWGRAWRWKAPRRARALYRLGELAPADLVPTLDPAATRTPLHLPEPTPETADEPSGEQEATHPDEGVTPIGHEQPLTGRELAAAIYRAGLKRGVEFSYADLAATARTSTRQASYAVDDVRREMEEEAQQGGETPGAEAQDDESEAA